MKNRPDRNIGTVFLFLDTTKYFHIILQIEAFSKITHHCHFDPDFSGEKSCFYIQKQKQDSSLPLQRSPLDLTAGRRHFERAGRSE